MQHYNSEYARKMLDLNPDWMAIAVDECGDVNWTSETFDRDLGDNYWYLKGTSRTEKKFGYLGQFTYDGDWKDTLVVRKCGHEIEHSLRFALIPNTWKYCPKCGELLGSK